MDFNRASLVAQTVKCLPILREIWVRSLSLEDPLEKEMAPHSDILAWKIPWTEEPGRLHVYGVAKSQTRLSEFTSLHFTSGILSFSMGVREATKDLSWKNDIIRFKFMKIALAAVEESQSDLEGQHSPGKRCC